MSVVANVAINVDSRGAVGKLRDVQNQAQATERAFGGLGAAIGKLAIAATAIQAARFVFAKTAEIESQTRSLQVLTGSAQKAKQIVEELQQLGAVTPFTSTELIDAAKRLQAFGVEANNVVETTRRLADASGATGAELQGLVTAYGQVQAKGRLQGEELLQFQERGIALQEELRKMYGMTGEEFQKALGKGQISAKAVEVALQRLTSAGGKYANGAIAQSDTLNGKLSTLQDSFQRLAQNIGKFFEPVFKFLIDGINAFLERVNSAAALQNQTRAYQEAATRTRNKFGARVANPFDTEVQQYRQRLEESLINAGRVAPAPTAPNVKAPPLLGGTKPAGAGGGGAAKGKSDAEQAAERAARIQAEVQGLQRQVALTKQLTFLDEQIANAEAAKDQQLVIRLQGEEKLLQLRYQLADELAKAETQSQRDAAFAKATAEADRVRVGIALELSKNEEDRQKTIQDIMSDLDMELIKLQAMSDKQRQVIRFLEIENQLKSQGIILTDGDAEAIRRKIAELDKANKAQEAITAKLQMEKDLFEGIANTVSGAFSSAINAAVSGTENFGEALKKLGADLLSTIGQMLIMYSIAQAFGALGGKDGVGVFSFLAKAFGFKSAEEGAYWSGGFQAFANGGMVDRPTLGLVGEGGESEYIIPASKMRSAMSRYAAGARGSAVIPAGDDTSSGGGTATMAPAAIDVRYTVERINSVDYVTADQFRTGMAQAAQQGATQGEQRTLRRLQQSRATRSRLGMN